MSEENWIILSWVLGWLIASVGYFIYNVYLIHDTKVNKKVHAWRAFWVGSLSWIIIGCTITLLIVGGIIAFDEWVEDKLK